MSKTKHTESTADIKLQAIELLNCSLNLPDAPGVSLNSFNFNIDIENKTDYNNKLLFVIVNVAILSEDNHYTLGTFRLSCIYNIVNFDEIIKINSNNKIDIPDRFIEKLNDISISTARGVMFSSFKGTFLHNAFLPLIDTKISPSPKEE